MSNFSIIQNKLEDFIKRYYTNELIRGAILFFAIGLLYFLVVLLVEYFLWLNSLGRMILFWTFIGFETLLFFRFIAYPMAKLFKLRQGIDHDRASKIIGNHFPEVNDKLLNVIQLNRSPLQSELLAASIDQKANELQPIPFQKAINFRKNIRYLKYAMVPVAIYLLFVFLGGSEIFSSSYTRVVNYDTAYEPPAPFSFVIMNDDLSAIEGKPFTLQVRTEGNVVPENASIEFKGESYYMQQVSSGIFEFTFQQPQDQIEFRFRANTVRSRDYFLEVVKTPSLLNFEMHLTYPSYLGKTNEIRKGSGNAVVPEGTSVSWKILAKNTDEITLKETDSTYYFVKDEEGFTYSKSIFSKFDYQIATSNANLENYENLSYSLGVIKDQYPEIQVESKVDSLNQKRVLFLGRVSDDYGLTKLRLVYFPEDNPRQIKYENIPLNKSNYDQFTFVFPGTLTLEEGRSYDYYFEVFDNDAIHHFKSSKSGTYSYRRLTSDELDNEQLREQHRTIQDLDKSLENLKEHKEALSEISRTQKEKDQLNFNDKRKLESFIQRQKQQEEMMKKFSEKLKEELREFQPENKETDPFKEELGKRLDENEERLKENEKLLDELEKLQDKIKKEELGEKLEKLAKQNKNQERNLEQLLELTKRYYVEKKAEKLVEELFRLGEEQEKLASEDPAKNNKESQEKLNEAFEDYKKEFQDLKNENDKLKSPLDIPEDKAGEQEVDQEQDKATDKLEKNNQQGASENQKKAGQKMKQMSQKMKQQMRSGQQESLDEDVRMLRQILDNLVIFSFKQEDLIETFRNIQYGNPVYGQKLTVQNELKLNFEHIDDSLFALSLRQPLLGDKINSTLTDIQFNIEKSLERLAKNNLSQGIMNQQYTMKGANDLAVLLDDLLANLQMQMQMAMGGGGGEGKPQQGEGEFQLPDIIQKQEGLNQKMQEGLEKGKSEGSQEGEGEQGNEGENDGDGGSSGQGNSNQTGPEGRNQDGFSEDVNGELYEIYKQQQQLRQQLEDRMSKEGLQGVGSGLLRKMEAIEQKLLDKGFNQQTLQEMQKLKYELLKLDKAVFEQGQEERRESTTNLREFGNQGNLGIEEIKKYFNTTEILNREALPLRPDYKHKVQEYFKVK